MKIEDLAEVSALADRLSEATNMREAVIAGAPLSLLIDETRVNVTDPEIVEQARSQLVGYFNQVINEIKIELAQRGVFS